MDEIIYETQQILVEREQIDYTKYQYLISSDGMTVVIPENIMLKICKLITDSRKCN